MSLASWWDPLSVRGRLGLNLALSVFDVPTPLRLRCFYFEALGPPISGVAFGKGTRLLALENADDILGETKPALHNIENIENYSAILGELIAGVRILGSQP